MEFRINLSKFYSIPQGLYRSNLDELKVVSILDSEMYDVSIFRIVSIISSDWHSIHETVAEDKNYWNSKN